MLFSEIDFLLTFDFKGNTNLIILQDELMTILTTENKEGHFINKDIWISRLGDICLIVNQKTRRQIMQFVLKLVVG